MYRRNGRAHFVSWSWRCRHDGAQWLAHSSAKRFREEVLHRGALISAHIDPQKSTELFEAGQSGTQDNGYVLWSLWSLERWLMQSVVGRTA